MLVDRLLGHVLRVKRGVPANIASARFFAVPDALSCLGRTTITLPIVLHRDLQKPPRSLASLEGLNQLCSFAADGKAWKAFTQRVVVGLTRGHKRPGRLEKNKASQPALAPERPGKRMMTKMEIASLYA
ncbi:hypothetical protein SPRG_18336 [Saprolegnia parasitica CBS 223.65]|uniref:Uncharacterized protein n=1 Tax=Saprolegnia parasitica (strain CBS 223.65) TaxID=695850 RepID=A0A067BCQ6_SAPPC|nr:hypothetical protein SPRG_18336 [Saprolegnia parasitica CBS 223.65]KDO16129.1 hypothetical protein SPRG_18336 [Saprolegnia parasitica CBS 223.65]|eukprot:XP_012213164.1 hypothetical protein SPRG_18336 [Saprolegnia parasitica CBS 223.65]